MVGIQLQCLGGGSNGRCTFRALAVATERGSLHSSSLLTTCPGAGGNPAAAQRKAWGRGPKTVATEHKKRRGQYCPCLGGESLQVRWLFLGSFIFLILFVVVLLFPVIFFILFLVMLLFPVPIVLFLYIRSPLATKRCSVMQIALEG